MSGGPAKRIEDMTPEERLRSLRDFAEEQKFVRPGEGGTLPTNTVGGMNSLVLGGLGQTTGYQGSLAPPSYATATAAANGEMDGSVEKPGLLARWRERRRAKEG